jgi:hypothetical protein
MSKIRLGEPRPYTLLIPMVSGRKGQFKNYRDGRAGIRRAKRAFI